MSRNMHSNNISILILVCIIIGLFLMLYKLKAQPKGDFGLINIKDVAEGFEFEGMDGDEKEGLFLENRKYKYDEFQAGFNVLVYGSPNLVEAKGLFRHLTEIGVNSVAIVFPLYQTDWQASEVMTNSIITPTLEELEGLILTAQGEDLSVMLRPILDEKTLMATGHWRGSIWPRDTKKWFDSYSLLLLKYAELAEKTGVEIFNIGTEFNSLQGNLYSREWLNIINEIRGIYKGDLIYSFNWDCFREIPSIEFVSKLDYIGIDAYFPLAVKEDATVEDLIRVWNKWMREIKVVLKGKGIIITEVGMIPMAEAYRKPYVWNIPGGKLDWQAQANYYEATFRVWEPEVEGIYWWCVTIDKPHPNSITFSPLGAPAEEVIKQLFLNNYFQNTN